MRSLTINDSIFFLQKQLKYPQVSGTQKEPQLFEETNWAITNDLYSASLAGD